MLTNTSCGSPRHVLVEWEVTFHLQDDGETRPFVQADADRGEHVQDLNRAQPLRGGKRCGTLSPNSQRDTVPVPHRDFPSRSADLQETKQERGRKKRFAHQKGCKNVITMLQITLPIWCNLTRCNGRKVGFKQSKARFVPIACPQHWKSHRLFRFAFQVWFSAGINWQCCSDALFMSASLSVECSRHKAQWSRGFLCQEWASDWWHKISRVIKTRIQSYELWKEMCTDQHLSKYNL